MKQNLSDSVCSFERLPREGYLRVGRTGYIRRSIAPAGRSLFPARPRRFGKALTEITATMFL